MVIGLLFTLGQSASALLLLYGAWLVMAPALKTRVAMDDEALLLRHLHSE